MTTTTATKPAGIAAYLPDLGAYVACLASYNNGCLHGAWVDLESASTVEEVQECIDWEAVWERGDISQYFWGSQGGDGFHIFRSC